MSDLVLTDVRKSYGAVEVIKGVMVTNINAEGVNFKRGDAVEQLAAKTVL